MAVYVMGSCFQNGLKPFVRTSSTFRRKKVGHVVLGDESFHSVQLPCHFHMTYCLENAFLAYQQEPSDRGRLICGCIGVLGRATCAFLCGL